MHQAAAVLFDWRRYAVPRLAIGAAPIADLRTDGQILHQWANQYTARITVNVQESNIKIEASQDGIEEIEKRMAILFLDAKSEELDLSAVLKAGQFDWSLVPAISRTTQTFIERLDDTNVRCALRYGISLC